MDYKEIYETLNDKQRKKLADTIDYALVSKLPDCITMFLAMQSVLENDEDLCLNRDQLMLFNDISKYIIENRERIRELIYEETKKEFFESIYRLAAEQEELKKPNMWLKCNPNLGKTVTYDENINPKED